MRNYIVLIFILFFQFSNIYAQEGIVSGVLEDETGPMPAVMVKIKGTNLGTQTDFDGYYSIHCSVGDVLVFSYIGMRTKEVVVTAQMLGGVMDENSVLKSPVMLKESQDYQNLAFKIPDSISKQQNNFHLPYVLSGSSYFFPTESIKKLEFETNVLKVTQFESVYRYEIDLNIGSGLKYADKSRLPGLQRAYAQGRPQEGSLQWFGPETGEIFSYGPNINSLVFDGSDYAYDDNGRLIIGSGGNTILPYKNSMLRSRYTSSYNLAVKVANEINLFRLGMRYESEKDIFNLERISSSQLNFDYKYKQLLDFNIHLEDYKDEQPNINGILNHALMSAWITPVTFQNSQGFLLGNDQQRSFSPDNFNNPEWLLGLSGNEVELFSLTSSVNSKVELGEEVTLNLEADYVLTGNDQNFRLPMNSVGFESGYSSRKQIDQGAFHALSKLGFNAYIDNITSLAGFVKLEYDNTTLDFKLLEQSGFSGFDFQEASEISQKDLKLTDNVFRYSGKIDFDLYFADAFLSLTNNGVISKYQGTKLFLPTVLINYGFQELFYIDWINRLNLSVGWGKDVKLMPLYYNNQSHNSLGILPEELAGLKTNNDLFVSDFLDFESVENLDLGMSIDLFNYMIGIEFAYFQSTSKNSIFPILRNNGFELQNIAKIRNRGVDASLVFNLPGYGHNFDLSSSFQFSTFKGKVLDLNGETEKVPIAGFANISNSLIQGEQTGTLIGSGYLRDQQGNKIIDDSGYPIVAENQMVIGNVTPDFNLSMMNEIDLWRFNLKFLLDFQSGGDVWNGTKNILNYLGRSKESGDLRNTTGYIFQGVDRSGQPNMIPVDFANPDQNVTENRWVRYGFDGVDEDAIVDATYFNIKSVSLGYDVVASEKSTLFREFRISLYATNLYCITRSKGISPYNSLFGFTSGNGLDLFNIPLQKEAGIKIDIKI
ncbi:carboxypeptidase-like regulatory domain-containing protein [Robertkochia solimangrovi]|uniref:carboxypeptidase-like regulatory domain-containing protein n=1 Tax=Robertkochia solimangrovi TaxID=2213046 RepID=UPI00117DC560|nr:carboxypeptidase-like regulatory domain-containing protein [Robertkochia solimangrovi]TRZ41180.1 hypothetical protein DMZ48_18070 [Robertkochia solimangrovi]